MKTMAEMREQLASRASQDEDFRSRLLSEPKAAVEDELGITLPENFQVKVHEDSATVANFVMPPSPRLGTEKLEQVTGGNCGGEGTCWW